MTVGLFLTLDDKVEQGLQDVQTKEFQICSVTTAKNRIGRREDQALWNAIHLVTWYKSFVSGFSPDIARSPSTVFWKDIQVKRISLVYLCEYPPGSLSEIRRQIQTRLPEGTSNLPSASQLWEAYTMVSESMVAILRWLDE
jgi:hypothetical protein